MYSLHIQHMRVYPPLTQYISLYNIHLLNLSESETYKFANFELYHTFLWVGFQFVGCSDLNILSYNSYACRTDDVQLLSKRNKKNHSQRPSYHPWISAFLIRSMASGFRCNWYCWIWYENYIDNCKIFILSKLYSN